MKEIFSFILFILLINLWSCSDLGVQHEFYIDSCGTENGDNSSCISFSEDIYPIFVESCIYCHGTDGGLSLESYNEIMNSNIITINNSDQSILVQKLNNNPPFGSQMPLGSEPLNEAKIELIETWINEGAINN